MPASRRACWTTRTRSRASPSPISPSSGPPALGTSASRWRAAAGRHRNRDEQSRHDRADQQATEGLDLSYRLMDSGAGHDTQFMAELTRAGTTDDG